ncbi:MAG: glycosyltransferase [Verrucomicrobia bacterium]|nr:glycosyltransferase [Verrucomicrobiota bacterium]MDA1067220.1 glycosyltransferase [Verrucomicrobiota bacterium]
MKNHQSPEISVVIPVFNEEDCLPKLFYRLLAVLETLGRSYEVIFVDDGSTDDSLDLLEAFCEDYHGKVRLVEFNGNYGQFNAICAGFEFARGKIAVTLDADLQNPPEEIPKLLELMDRGHDYVGGIRSNRKDSWMRRWSSRLNNYIREKITNIRITDQGCMLRAYSGSIIKAVVRSRERSVFVSALAYKFASNPAEVEVAHEGRSSGKSRYNYFNLMELNFDLITGFSLWPLQTLTLLGFGVFCTGFICLVALFLSAFLFQIQISSIGLFLLSLILVIGVLCTGLGLIGEYVGRIYHEVLRRPNFLIKRVVDGENEMPLREAK